jgi:hypothetical protein
MGIKLDWEIESEQSGGQHNIGEEATSARQRRRTWLRLLLLVLIVVGVLGGAAAAVISRLRTIDDQIEMLLRNTVDAEITALRIGDLNAFLTAQRSASNDWLLAQQGVFNDYQTLKQQNKIELTGQILGLTIDKNRARVQVQEILSGVPYTRVWFYWRYEDGWRHVPPDYTFWGDVGQYQGKSVTVRYNTVDAPLANAMGASIDTWLATACAALPCGTLPTLSVEIIPDNTLQPAWSTANPWSIQIPSPFTDRARSDMPFDTAMQLKVSNLIADRLVSAASNNMQPTYPADAYYLRQAVISWLVGQFVQFDTNAFVISSLAKNYGPAAVGKLVTSLQPNSDGRVLATAAGVSSLEQAHLDWRDFLTWRLSTEGELIKRRDENNYMNLYDTHDETVRNLAAQRFNTAPPESPVVVSAQLETSSGTPVLRALAQVGPKDKRTQQEVQFRLVDGLWRRVN